MKSLFILSVVIAACAASAIKDSNESWEEGQRYFYFLGDDDDYHLVDLYEPPDEDFLIEHARNPGNEYHLFTRENPTTAQRIQLNDENSVQRSNFNPRRTTVFIAHGWNGSGESGMNLQLTEVFLRDGDVNVIVVDWNRLANRNYLTARNGVPDTGKHLGQLITYLVHRFGASFERMHLVGFSLGGHLVGAAGRTTGSLVKRITALDPAGPMWGGNRDRLVETDAQYVEVIHTNTRFLGFKDPCGHADFYPNGGASMPGCWTNNCSHGKAVDYMAASVTHNHLMASECSSFRDATRDRCNGTPAPMGNSDLHKPRHGIFRVNTGRNYPF